MSQKKRLHVFHETLIVEKRYLGLLSAAESRGSIFPIGGASPGHRLVVNATVEATAGGQCRESDCEKKEETVNHDSSSQLVE
jgi:hypothetical protein